MRYLFADSTPFPPQYDFLAAFEVFVENAARAVRLEAEARAMLEGTQQAALGRARSVEELEAIHASVVRVAREAALGATAPPITAYLQSVIEHAERLVADARRTAQSEIDRDRAEAQVGASARRLEERSAAERFLVALRLPVLGSRVTMGLVDGQHEIEVVSSHPENLVLSFALDTEGVAEWAKPRRVAEFAQEIVLPVGIKRSIFRRTVQHEPLKLDDHFVGGFTLGEDDAEIRLRRKPDQRDSLVFRLRRTEQAFLAEVEHPEDAAASELPPVLDAQSGAELERFWTLLRSACGPLLVRRARVLTAVLDGQDAFEGANVRRLVMAVVRIIAPTVVEIARRSPNPSELSLKVEDAEGRRQETYLKRALLRKKLDEVPRSERGIFEPLGLFGDPGGGATPIAGPVAPS